MNVHTDVTEWMREQSASMQDAEFAEAVVTAAGALEERDREQHATGHVADEAQPDALTGVWPFECPHEEGTASHALWEISDSFEETVGDLSALLDSLWVKPLEGTDADWRKAMATQLDREREHLNFLLEKAIRITRELTVEEEPWRRVADAGEAAWYDEIEGKTQGKLENEEAD